MDLQVISFLSCCLFPYFVNANVIVIHYDEELKRVLAEFNITEPTPEQKQFANKIIHERVEKEKEKYRMEKEKYHMEKQDYEARIRNLTDMISKKDQELGRLAGEKRGESDILWLVRVRSAVEFFQSEHGSHAQYSTQDWTRLQALKNRHERSCLFRELNLKWIFANKQHVHAVADLTNRIKQNPLLGTTDKFSELLATAVSDLSASIDTYLLTPGKGQYDVEFSTHYAETNEAVKEFWRTFAFAENIVKKITPQFTTVSTKPSTP